MTLPTIQNAFGIKTGDMVDAPRMTQLLRVVKFNYLDPADRHAIAEAYRLRGWEASVRKVARTVSTYHLVISLA